MAEGDVEVAVTLPSGTTLYDLLNVATPTGGERTEVARRLLADGAACQNVTIVDTTTLTCQELVDPTTGPVLTDGQAVEMIVLGDPFALRDSVIEGLSSTLNQFDQLAGDNVTGDGLADDQYTSTLPLADADPGPARRRARRPPRRPGQDGPRRGRGRALGSGHAAEVSSAQELSTAIGQLVGTGGAQPPEPQLRPRHRFARRVAPRPPHSGRRSRCEAAYRAQVGDLGQVQSQATLPVGVASETTLAIDVARDHRPDRDRRRDPHRLDGDRPGSGAGLDRIFQTGVGEATTSTDGSNRADLGVQVVTDFDPSTAGGSLVTTRSGTRGSERAAVMTLAFPDGTTVDYRADATGLLRRLRHRAARARGDAGRSSSPRVSTASPTRSRAPATARRPATPAAVPRSRRR